MRDFKILDEFVDTDKMSQMGGIELSKNPESQHKSIFK
jgi:hypothetical protein